MPKSSKTPKSSQGKQAAKREAKKALILSHTAFSTTSSTSTPTINLFNDSSFEKNKLLDMVCVLAFQSNLSSQASESEQLSMTFNPSFKAFNHLASDPAFVDMKHSAGNLPSTSGSFDNCSLNSPSFFMLKMVYTLSQHQQDAVLIRLALEQAQHQKDLAHVSLMMKP